MMKNKPEYFYMIEPTLFLANIAILGNSINNETVLSICQELSNGLIPEAFKDSIKGPYRVKKFPRPSPEKWKEIKTRILARDDYTCAYCGIRGTKLEVDHILPISRGGDHDDENLTAACMPCNRRKHTKTVEEWKALNV